MNKNDSTHKIMNKFKYYLVKMNKENDTSKNEIH